MPASIVKDPLIALETQQTELRARLDWSVQHLLHPNMAALYLGEGDAACIRYNPCDPTMPLTAGVRLGPYEVLSLVGAGGMGEVYRARDTRLDRTVAVKILPAALAADPQFRDRFDREAGSSLRR